MYENEIDLQQLPVTCELLSKGLLANAIGELSIQNLGRGSPYSFFSKLWWGFTPPCEGMLWCVLVAGFVEW
jgi:hypothetical protein